MVEMLYPDDRIFFSDTSEGAGDRTVVFWRIAQEFGLFPIFYKGADKNVIGSNVGYEFRRDMYSSKFAIIYLGAPTQDNNVAFYYLPYALSEFKLDCVIYASEDFNRNLLLSDTDFLPFRYIKDLISFEQNLRLDLAQRIESQV